MKNKHNLISNGSLCSVTNIYNRPIYNIFEYENLATLVGNHGFKENSSMNKILVLILELIDTILELDIIGF